MAGCSRDIDMQDWQIELAKAFGLAVIGFLGGYGTYWLKSRDRLAELRTLAQGEQN